MQYKEVGEDKLFIARIADGDQIAFRQLFDEYRYKVYSYAVRYLKSKEQSEEIVQEVFLRIWIKRSELSEINNFGGYLRVITNHLTLDALKRRATEYKTREKNLIFRTEEDNETEEGIILKDSKSYIGLVINKLPKQQRLVYQMCLIEGLQQKEVAEKLHLSPFTVKVHLREAIKRLRTLIEDDKSFPLISLIFLGLLK